MGSVTVLDDSTGRPAITTARLENPSSQRVLEKLRMRPVRRSVVDGLDTLFYSLARSDWQG